jgi:hypothetical protein
MNKKFKAEGSLSHWMIFGRIALIRMGADEISINPEGWRLQAIWRGTSVAINLTDSEENTTEITFEAESRDGLSALEDALDRQVLYPLTEEAAETHRENHEMADSLDVFERVEAGRFFNYESEENACDDIDCEIAGDQYFKNLPKGIQVNSRKDGKGWFVILLLVLALAIVAAIFFLAPEGYLKSDTTRAVAIMPSWSMAMINGDKTFFSDAIEFSSIGPIAA